MQQWLSGKKAYIIGALQVLIALVSYLAGDVSLSELFTSVQGLVSLLLGLNGFGTMAVRAGVSKAGKSII